MLDFCDDGVELQCSLSNTWSAYEVPITILLHNLKGPMQLDYSKDNMSVHVSTCTSYNFNI